MAKRSRKPIDIEKYWKSGAGQETGSAYIPWLRVQSFSSLGGANRPKGWKTGRSEYINVLQSRLSALESGYVSPERFEEFRVEA
jgi:hypothetical protein